MSAHVTTSPMPYNALRKTDEKRWKTMKLTMLGTGNALVTECYNTCFAIDDEGKTLMVDGGAAVPSCARSNTRATTGWTCATS